MGLLVVVLVAILGGIAVAVQAQIIGDIDARLGTLASVFVTYVTGGILIFVLLAASGGLDVTRFRTLPWQSWLAGVTGLVIIGAIAFTSSRIGVVRALTLVTLSQFVLAATIDHFGLLGADVRTIDLGRALGIVLLSAGTWLVLR